MERKKRAAPKRAANGKKAAAKPTKKKTKTETDDGDIIDGNGITGHLDDDVTVALPHENGSAHQLDNEDVKITKPTTPKLTDQQLMDALLLPSADTPPTTKQPQPSSSDLLQPEDDLPSKFTRLEQFFNALLNVCLCLKSRKQSCTWSLMKAPIESMCNSTLHLSHIAQMQTVIPNALKVLVWKHTTTNKLGKELAIEIVSPSTSQPLNHSTLAQLRQTFHENLIQLVQQHHSAFLASAKQKAPKPPARWNSLFDLESVPDIPLTPLPSALTDTQQDNTKEPEKLDLPSIEKYIESKPVPAELAGISLATIAAARETEEAIATESEEVQLMRRLPAVVRTMHGLCVGEKKRAFKKAQLLSQMVSCSAAPLSHEEAVQALEKLVQVVPQWIATYRTDDETEWVRFSRDVTMANCLAAIQKESKK